MTERNILFGDIPFDLSFNNVEDGQFVIKSAGELFAGEGDKTILVFGLPGAFTPTCSTQQLPGFEELYDQFQDAGIDEIYCTSVNDGFVMSSWFDSLGIEKVKPLADGNGKFARLMGMLVDKGNIGFGLRSWRYAAIINNGQVIHLFAEKGLRDNHEEDPYDASVPQTILDFYNNLYNSHQEDQTITITAEGISVGSSVEEPELEYDTGTTIESFDANGSPIEK
jgi:peroxiredoxin